MQSNRTRTDEEWTRIEATLKAPYNKASEQLNAIHDQIKDEGYINFTTYFKLTARFKDLENSWNVASAEAMARYNQVTKMTQVLEGIVKVTSDASGAIEASLDESAQTNGGSGLDWLKNKKKHKKAAGQQNLVVHEQMGLIGKKVCNELADAKDEMNELDKMIRMRAEFMKEVVIPRFAQLMEHLETKVAEAYKAKQFL